MAMPSRRTAFATTAPAEMRDLYKRLKTVGYDAGFVRACILPDWWSDDLASVPANRTIAEIAIARAFGFRIADLRQPDRPLALPPRGNIRLKRNAGTTVESVAAMVAAARHAAELVADLVENLPEFDGPALAASVRATILRQHAYVDLDSLLVYCWSHGIPVVHVRRTPTGSKKVDGLATFRGRRPVIVLSSGRDSPPWLAFHLAHELGHILLAHVSADGDLLVDQKLDARDDDQQEQAADRFACELLTGQPEPGFKPTRGLTAAKLALAAWQYGEQHRNSPGTVVLIYGRSANRWGPAVAALKYLSLDTGAHQKLGEALAAHLNLDDLPETSARFLSGCAGLAV